jgi:hypothetical protein
MAIYYSLFNLYEVDNTLFDDIKLYEKIDKETLVNTVWDIAGENEPLYFTPEYMKAKINNFFLRNYEQFKNICDILLKEYDELYPDSYVETTIDDGINESTISAYNESDYQNANKDYIKNTQTKTRKGNNGVRTLTALIKDKADFMSRYNIYDIIAKKFASELTVRVRYR